MTFISTIISRQGIILTADSKELVQGGQLLWKDFVDILELRQLNEDDNNFSISPYEIKEKFKANSLLTKSRVLSKDGAKKIFQIGTHYAILISGTPNPGGKEFSEIVEKIKNRIEDNSFDKVLEATFIEINSLMTIELSKEKDKSEILFCGYDEKTDLFKVSKFSFVDKYIMDDKGEPKLDDEGKKLKEGVFKKYNRNQLINMAGWTTHVLGMETSINQSIKEIEILEAFELSNRIMELVVTIENVSNSIPGIGGRIYYAAITRKGFKWINSKTDLMNIGY